MPRTTPPARGHDPRRAAAVQRGTRTPSTPPTSGTRATGTSPRAAGTHDRDRDPGASAAPRRPTRAYALEMAIVQLADRFAWLLVTPLRAARTDTGKRVLTVAAAVLALGATVHVLYASAEPPATLADTPVAATSPAPAPAAEADAEPAEAAEPAEPPAATVPPNKPVKPTPEEAAVAFYAAELDLPEDRVRALMQTRINDNSVNVLVLADRGPEDLPTRLIQVNRTQTGWRVP